MPKLKLSILRKFWRGVDATTNPEEMMYRAKLYIDGLELKVKRLKAKEGCSQCESLMKDKIEKERLEKEFLEKYKQYKEKSRRKELRADFMEGKNARLEREIEKLKIERDEHKENLTFIADHILTEKQILSIPFLAHKKAMIVAKRPMRDEGKS